MTESAKQQTPVMPRLKLQYQEQIRAELKDELGLANINQVPELKKVVVSSGVGRNRDDKRYVEFVTSTLAKITGQTPAPRHAKKSIATFKIRKGMGAPLGYLSTLRGAKMYEFVDRLVNLALPRVRDFRGVNPNAFDGRGNYALGIKEQLIFPEIEYDKIDKVRGMDVIFVTTAKTDEEARELLRLFNMPFAK